MSFEDEGEGEGIWKIWEIGKGRFGIVEHGIQNNLFTASQSSFIVVSCICIICIV